MFGTKSDTCPNYQEIEKEVKEQYKIKYSICGSAANNYNIDELFGEVITTYENKEQFKSSQPKEKETPVNDKSSNEDNTSKCCLLI